MYSRIVGFTNQFDMGGTDRSPGERFGNYRHVGEPIRDALIKANRSRIGVRHCGHMVSDIALIRQATDVVGFASRHRRNTHSVKLRRQTLQSGQSVRNVLGRQTHQRYFQAPVQGCIKHIKIQVRCNHSTKSHRRTLSNFCSLCNSDEQLSRYENTRCPPTSSDTRPIVGPGRSGPFTPRAVTRRAGRVRKLVRDLCALCRLRPRWARFRCRR